MDFLAGYRQLIEDYFLWRQRGELDPRRGLSFTCLPADEAVTGHLVAHLVEALRRHHQQYLLLDWQAPAGQAATDTVEFRQFFSRLWELQAAGGDAEETQAYLERLQQVMRRSPEPDPATVPHLILHGLPPLAELGSDGLVRLQHLLSGRMEAGLPIFVFFRESGSELLCALQEASDCIWALEETAYPAEFYLFHPHGLRSVALRNRRRPLVQPPPNGHN